jgi:hypothetical protein
MLRANLLGIPLEQPKSHTNGIINIPSRAFHEEAQQLFLIAPPPINYENLQ